MGYNLKYSPSGGSRRAAKINVGECKKQLKGRYLLK